jgi:HSP20 family protein
MSDRNIAKTKRFQRPRALVNESKEGKLRVTLEMPGVSRENLELRIENNELRIVGHRDSQAEKKYILRERPLGDYHQIYTLDETVDQSKVDAVLEKGILTITLDLKEHVKPRTIAVRGE